MNNNTQLKINEFKSAIDKYNNNLFYNKFGIIVSITVIILQIISSYNLYTAYNHLVTVNYTEISLVFVCSYVLTDFINGFTHMIMDNNSNYTSFVGPFIAAFHLHHKQPTYKKMHPLWVYFYESGAKIWLPIYLSVVIYIQNLVTMPFNFSFLLVSLGILSSVAEVSHYWCHNSRKENIIISLLQNYGILLSKHHHKHHHISDNVNYAFLNGVTDPILNIIAKYLFDGYKNNTDIHVKAYNGLQSSNRA